MQKEKETDVYIITSDPTTKRNKPRGNKSMEGKEIPELEVKSNQSTYAVCSPTIHMKGHPYQIIGTREPINSMEPRPKSLIIGLLESTLNLIQIRITRILIYQTN